MKSSHKFTIKKVKELFSFLQEEYSFPDFECEQWKDEYTISSKKEDIEFDVYIQMFSDYCPNISIIQYENIDNENTLRKRYDVETLDHKNPNPIFNSIGKGSGKRNIESYIIKCADILKKHHKILTGNTEDYCFYSEDTYPNFVFEVKEKQKTSLFSRLKKLFKKL